MQPVSYIHALTRGQLDDNELHLQQGVYWAGRGLVQCLQRRDLQGGGGIGELHGLLDRHVLDSDGGVFVERLHRLSCK